MTAAPNRLGHAERRARFREYMRRFNPTAPAAEAIKAGLVLDDIHGGVHTKLASRAEIEPGSQQLLAGGIGSGKTTELLLAQQRLSQQPNTFPIFIDISAETDLSEIKPGTLIAAFARRAVDDYEKQKNALGKMSIDGVNLERAAKHLRGFAVGRWVAVYDDVYPGDEDEHRTWIPGRLQPPLPALERRFAEIAKPLRDLLPSIYPSGDIVVLFDGLDRLLTAEKFWSNTESDFHAFRELRISVITTAPLPVLFGAGKAVSDQFDRVHHLSAIPDRNAALKLVLKQRDASGIIGENESEYLCRKSGGVLRDLITLARDAGEESYVAGEEIIGIRHITSAAQQLGLSYLRGLGPEQIAALLNLEKTRSFNLAVSDNLELLVTRRVIEYSPTDFQVHPSLLPLLSSRELRIA